MVVPYAVDGTSFYRAYGPLCRLKGVELVPFNGRTDWPNLLDIDLAFVQRPNTQDAARSIAEIKKLNIPVVIDYDDDLFNVDPSNPVYDIHESDDKKEAARECIRLADVVFASTNGLRDVLLEEVPQANVVVIGNAVDDYLFHVEPSFHERNNIIVMRGSSSHSIDWTPYAGEIIQLMKDLPDYKLAVMGYHPDWLREIPDSQLMMFQFQDIPTYFQSLMELRPKLGIVPLADTKFNNSKSNIAWQEFTLAGAAVMSSYVGEFTQVGLPSFEDNLRECAKNVLNDHHLYYNWSSVKCLPRLSQKNEQRREIFEQLISDRQKIKPLIKPKLTATSEEFHKHEQAYGYTQDHKGYRELTEVFARWVLETLNPKTALELGCGTGGNMVALLSKGVMVRGLDYNEHSVKYFQERHPMYESLAQVADLTKEPLELDVPVDLMYSIEVFEHIKQPEEWWNQFISGLAKQTKNFYFSSTPYYSTEFFDHYWGHINIRKRSEWINLFERNGFKFVSNPKISTKWDLLFESNLTN